MDNTLWGANPEEWALWRSLRPEHLLPTVCNPEAAVSKKSQLYRIDKTTGQSLHPAKVPSLYNRKKQIAGIRQWASLPITPAMLDSWQQEPDYGICVRTGQGLIALDCDSEDEGYHAIIERVLRDTLGCLPPCRFRENSNKCLYLLKAPFERRKSVLRLPDEDGRPAQIELLAIGQQFMAAGIHPSGARIAWRCEGELCPVAVSEEQLEAIQARLRALLPVVTAPISTSEKSSDDDVADLQREITLARVDEQTFDDIRSALWYTPVLEMAGPYSSWVDMGNRLVCLKGTEYEERARELWLEWSATVPNGDIEAAAAKWDNDALKADRTGYQAIFTRAQKKGWINPGAERMRLSSVASVEDFADVSVAEKGDEVAEYLPWPKFTRDKNDKIEGVISNVLLALRRPDLCGVQIRLDEFRDEIILTTPKGKNIQLRDEYYTKLHTTLESLGFKKFEEAAIKRAVRLIAWENRFDSLKEWVNALPAWDGVPRIDTFFTRHWGIAESAYTRSVGRYWWTLLAGRALVPGIKGDMAVILVSQQGKNKSEGIRAMAPTPEHYMELDFGKKGEERIREMRGHNVIELGEMRGMDKRGIGDVRVTISTRADRNRGLFREHYVTLPRRCGFIGTSNSDTPLTDTEGNRRWLPMTIPDDTDGKFIAQGIADEKIQLWAEAVAVFKRDGIAWENAETLAKSILGDYEVKDEVWMSCVAEWLEQYQDQYDVTADSTTKNYERVPLTSKDILIEAIGFKAPQVKRGDEMKIATTMKKLGYKKRQLQSLPGKPYHWQKCE